MRPFSAGRNGWLSTPLIGAILAGTLATGFMAVPARGATVPTPATATTTVVPLVTGGQVVVRTTANGKPTYVVDPSSGGSGNFTYAGTIGNGSRDIHASSVNGSIELRRQ